MLEKPRTGGGYEGLEVLEKLLNRTQAVAKVDIKKDQWHTLRVRIKGDMMKVFLDEEMQANLRSLGFAHLTKNKFGFTVNGDSIDFDNLRVCRLQTRDSK